MFVVLNVFLTFNIYDKIFCKITFTVGKRRIMAKRKRIYKKEKYKKNIKVNNTNIKIRKENLYA